MLARKNSYPLPAPPFFARKIAQQLVYRLPAMVKRLPKPPFYLQKVMTEQLLHKLLAESLAMGEWEFLQEKWLHLNINDMGLSFYFTYRNEQLLLSDKPARADVSFSGDAREFILLASRSEDPDTLFFQRRLVIEGDTELGLYIKNAIDGIDFDQWPAWLNDLFAKVATLIIDNGYRQAIPSRN